MGMSMIGDLSRHLVSVRHNAQIKDRLNTLSQELSTGRVWDLTGHLGRDQARFHDTTRQLDLIKTQVRSLDETENFLSVAQLALTRTGEAGESAATALLSVVTETSPQQRAAASTEAERAFEAMVGALNTHVADRPIFGGTELGQAPLSNGSDMLQAVVTAASGATDAAGVVAAVDTWFDSPGGGFMMSAYAGSTTDNLVRPIGDGEVIEIQARADHGAIRATLKAAALGAIAGDAALALSDSDRASLLRRSGEALVESALPLTQLRADLGASEERIGLASTRLSAQETALSIARNEMSSADSYETASALQQVQLQLETHYTLTARLSRLSLTEYLR
ncbi:MAG: hypothetical protein GVY31_09345 [Alphaproteobacteria bacterium]|nr:hypothetical protein [Alphaproteobacteria bacterium]